RGVEQTAPDVVECKRLNERGVCECDGDVGPVNISDYDARTEEDYDGPVSPAIRKSVPKHGTHVNVSGASSQASDREMDRPGSRSPCAGRQNEPHGLSQEFQVRDRDLQHATFRRWRIVVVRRLR